MHALPAGALAGPASRAIKIYRITARGSEIPRAQGTARAGRSMMRAMIVACPSCHARYRFDEAKLGNRPRARTKCAKCGAAIDIENPVMGGVTLPPEDLDLPPSVPSPAPRPSGDQEKTAKRRAISSDDPAVRTHPGGSLEAPVSELPKDKRYSLAVIQGPATGSIYQLAKQRVTLGRAGADIVVDDPEASRLHCQLELLGDHATLKDLDSTNGTYVDADRIDQHTLYNQGEFRIGSHVLMFIITGLE
jgi:predicted Zn finger-like uncharacterized protein